jgi:hypothetical protein
MGRREIWMAIGTFLLGAAVTVAISSIPFALTGVACSSAVNLPGTPDCQLAITRFAAVPIGLSALTVGGTTAVLAARKGVWIAVIAAIVAGACAGALVAAYWFKMYS